MADTKAKVTTTAETSGNHEVIQKAKGFWDRYSKPITYVGGAIILAIAGWYSYLNFVKLPKEKAANEMIYAAEAIFDKMASTSFSKDSVNIVINGGALEGKKITGLLKVISTYEGTPSGNRAKYMTGACYLQIKEFDKAIKYLKEFDGNGAAQVQATAYKMIGDAYAEQKKTEDAFTYYKKAIAADENDETITPGMMLIAASYADVSGKTKDAIDLYKQLKEKFPAFGSVSNGEVDKQLARLGQFDN